MPPFREGPINFDRQIDGDLLKFLYEVGHGHRINIVDASYDIPHNSRVLKYPGSTSDAIRGIVSLIPIEDCDLMYPDPDSQESKIMRKAYLQMAQALNTPAIDNDTFSTGIFFRLDKDSPDGKGFYTIAKDPGTPHTFIRTRDDLPFACAGLIVGHSQRTE
jgi:hypothetical protein